MPIITRPFPEGTDLATELRKAMNRLQDIGMLYPQGYYDKLFRKYSDSGISYPRVLMHAGDGRIREHPFYLGIIQRNGRLLDYGCGTGDDIRALIRDGYPKEKVTGFDIDWGAINLGFDLYLDRERMQDIFVVSEDFPFGNEEFDVVYSSGVIHALSGTEEKEHYLANAHDALRRDGILFGSTLGADNPSAFQRPPGMLKPEELERLLLNAGFRNVETSKAALPTDEPRYRLCFYGVN